MSFFHALGRILGGRSKLDDQEQQHLISAWNLYDDSSRPAGSLVEETSADAASDAKAAPYDQGQWRRKLKSILEKLPQSQARWADLAAEVRALKLDPDWVRQAFREEFTLLVRRAVADGVVTPEEHKRIDLARHLVGLPEAEAEEILYAVVTEAEAFLGKPVAGA
jgi:hypothetical protein